MRARLPERPTFAEAVQSIYQLYAESQGKQRFGDKTPLYMQHLDVLDRAFPDARYVHIVRDGRDAARLAARDDAQAALQPLPPARHRRLRGRVAA